jgi:O-acetyl-ADP-ribose deacetylase (regulator of RNase III)
VRKQGGCRVGEAVITSGGNLSAKFVIHTVGPVWHGGNSNEKQLLANAYNNSLRLAEEKKLSSVAFPNVSTGVYGFPKQPAAEIAIGTVQQFMKTARHVKQVIFVCYDEENLNIYQRLLG